MLRDVRRYARLQLPEGPLPDVLLENVMQHALDALHDEITSTSAVVEYNALPKVPGDYDLLQEMFSHVIGNALQYRRCDDRPFIKVQHDLRLGKGGRNCVVLTITDNGLGFDQHHAEAVFTLFQSVGEDIAEERTGYGLAACRKIVDLHGGEISITSDRSVGTTVTIVLPAERAENSVGERADDEALLRAGLQAR